MDRSSAIARILSPRASMYSARRRGQRGFVLLAVLGIVFFFAIVGVAVMAMTQTTGNVVVGLTSATQSSRESDSALEAAANYFRTQGTPGVSCANPATAPPNAFEGISVACTDGVAPNPDFRVLDLVATSGGVTTGKARVKVNDKADVVDLPVPGYSIEVCDWEIGTDAATGALDDCP
jgi:hypothetical protein